MRQERQGGEEARRQGSAHNEKKQKMKDEVQHRLTDPPAPTHQCMINTCSRVQANVLRQHARPSGHEAGAWNHIQAGTCVGRPIKHRPTSYRSSAGLEDVCRRIPR